MPKKQSSKQRTKAKDLSQEKKLSGKEMKKVKGGFSLGASNPTTQFNPKEIQVDMVIKSGDK